LQVCNCTVHNPSSQRKESRIVVFFGDEFNHITDPTGGVAIEAFYPKIIL
jgi:hypothetical protein